MEPEGMRKGWIMKVMMKIAVTMMPSSDWMAGRMPSLL
jgi:hypothetical protein